MLVNQPTKAQPVKGNAAALDARIKDSMPWWGSLIAILAAVGYCLLPDNIATLALLATSVGLGLGHDLIHPALSERLSVVLICNVWAYAAARTYQFCGPRTFILPPLALFVITSSIGWARWGQSRRRSATVQNHTRNMLARRADWHIAEGLKFFSPDITHESIVTIPRGLRWTWKVAGIGTAKGMELAAAVFERLHLPRRFVRIFEHELSGQVVSEYTPGELPAVKWTPTPPLSVNKGFAVAKDEYGVEVKINPVGNHVFVGGMSDAGKSRFLLLICAWAIAAPDIQLVIVDPTKHGDDFRMFKEHALLWGDTMESCRRVLAQVRGIVDTRYAHKDYHGSWQPTVEAPQIFVVVDEGSDINADKLAKPLLQELARASRGAGISLFVGTQHPHFELFPKDVMANIDYRFCLKVKSVAGGKMVIPELTDSRATQLPKGGHCYVSSPAYMEPTLARIWHIESDVLEAFAATHRPVEALSEAPAGVAHEMPAPQPESTGSTGATAVDPQVKVSVVETVERLTPAQRRIVDQLEVGPMSDKELAVEFSVSVQAINKQTKVLADQGRIVKDGAGRWRLEEEVNP